MNHPAQLDHREHPSPSQDFMADSLQYPNPSHYMPAAYYAQPHVPGHMHVVAAPPRQDVATQRKRPKYTRSKTGCLTCRAKKIKCDESKPNCMRCTHGQRECTWPEGVPARKKPAPRREQPIDTGLDTRPSTAGSSGVSDTSTPPARHETPPKREPIELGLPPMVSRRQSDPSMHHQGMGGDGSRRANLMPPGSTSGYSVPSSSNQLLPAIPEMNTAYHPQYTQAYPSSSQYQQNQHLLLSRGGNHHDSIPAMRTMDQSSHQGQWSSPSMLHPVDPIEPYFPTVQERNLIRHYCDNALSIIMALPAENPVLAANLQFVLGSTRGSDFAVESLRAALLGVAAIHQSFLLSRNGVSGADEVMQLASSYRTKSRQLLAKACSTSEGTQSDASLGAVVAIALIDIFFGGQNWFKNLELAKNLVNMRGGPAVLLARSEQSKSGSVTGVSRARLLLEIIAVYEIFGCLANCQQPTLLSTQGWWLVKANSDDSHSYVEKVFGMSREFVPLLARVTSFLARALGTESRISEIPDTMNGHSCIDHREEARMLYDTLARWTPPADEIPERVEAGNQIYQHASQIALLRDVLELPPDDPLVQQHASKVLSLCLRCGQNKMGVDLNWPVIIAGSQIFGNERNRVLEIFEVFRTQCCFEIETSEHIVLQVWRRMDENLARADWRSVMQDNKLDVLIL